MGDSWKALGVGVAQVYYLCEGVSKANSCKADKPFHYYIQVVIE